MGGAFTMFARLLGCLGHSKPGRSMPAEDCSDARVQNQANKYPVRNPVPGLEQLVIDPANPKGMGEICAAHQQPIPQAQQAAVAALEQQLTESAATSQNASCPATPVATEQVPQGPQHVPPPTASKDGVQAPAVAVQYTPAKVDAKATSVTASSASVDSPATALHLATGDATAQGGSPGNRLSPGRVGMAATRSSRATRQGKVRTPEVSGKENEGRAAVKRRAQEMDKAAEGAAVKEPRRQGQAARSSPAAKASTGSTSAPALPASANEGSAAGPPTPSLARAENLPSDSLPSSGTPHASGTVTPIAAKPVETPPFGLPLFVMTPGLQEGSTPQVVGVRNTSRKYNEARQLRRNNTPFEVRLERDLEAEKRFRDAYISRSSYRQQVMAAVAGPERHNALCQSCCEASARSAAVGAHDELQE